MGTYSGRSSGESGSVFIFILTPCLRPPVLWITFPILLLIGILFCSTFFVTVYWEWLCLIRAVGKTACQLIWTITTFFYCCACQPCFRSDGIGSFLKKTVTRRPQAEADASKMIMFTRIFWRNSIVFYKMMRSLTCFTNPHAGRYGPWVHNSHKFICRCRHIAARFLKTKLHARWGWSLSRSWAFCAWLHDGAFIHRGILPD